jgi:uncharacterized protein (DUF1778 family)
MAGCRSGSFTQRGSRPRAPSAQPHVKHLQGKPWDLRMSRAHRNVIARAAQTAGKTRTEFMIDAARRSAQETLLGTTLFLVDRGTFKRFKKLFDAPAQLNDRLRALLRQKAPWEP